MASSFTRLYSYSRWDGSQVKKRFHANDLMAAMDDDMLEYGNLQNALQTLMQHGMPLSMKNRLPGVQDLIRQLRNQRKAQLERFNLESALEGLQEKLDEILALEQETIEEWRHSNEWLDDDQTTDSVLKNQGGEASLSFRQDQAKNRQTFLNRLPAELPAQIKALQKEPFLNPQAEKKFQALLNQLRNGVAQTFFKDVQKMVQAMSQGDISQMRDMLKNLNALIQQQKEGKEPDFEAFMGKYGGMFGNNPPQSLEELMSMMASQMAASQSLLASLSPEQRRQLQSLFQSQLEDPALQEELMKLAQELSFLAPAGQEYSFHGTENIDLESAMRLMEELQQMQDLEEQLQGIHRLEDLNDIDAEALRKLLGEEAAKEFEELRDILNTLEQAGYIRKGENRWEMTNKGAKRIGKTALGEIYQQLKSQGLGQHRTRKEGRFGDRLEETRAYEFGDTFHLHVPRTLRNALQRSGKQLPIRLNPHDFEIYCSERQTKTATVLLLDLSWSMAMRGFFLSAKKVALALQNLIATSYPRDRLSIIGFSAYAKEIKPNDLPFVDVDQFTLGTNMQHALLMAERILSKEHGASKQVLMISDGEPTAHLEKGYPFFEYPPHPLTIQETLKAVRRCTKKGIAINTFMLDQNPFLKMFMNRVTKINGGRIFFTTPQRLGEYILYDYVDHKRKKLGRRR